MIATISYDIAICEKSYPEVCEDFDSNKNDEDEPSTKDIHEDYREMYDN